MDANNHALRIYVADFEHYRIGFLRGDWFELDALRIPELSAP